MAQVLIDKKNLEREYARKKAELDQREQNLIHDQNEVDKKEIRINREIDAEADRRSQKEKDQLRRHFKASVYGAWGYGILATIFTAVCSERFVADFKAFFAGIWAFMLWTWGKLLYGAKWASQIAQKIPNEQAADSVGWIILALVAIILIGLAGLLFFIAGYVVFRWYTDYITGFADGYSAAQALAALAVAVWFAEPIRSVLQVNLILLVLISHAVYIGVRWVIRSYRVGY